MAGKDGDDVNNSNVPPSSSPQPPPPPPPPPQLQVSNLHPPPMDFLCRICHSLMSDPITHSGLHADRTCIEAHHQRSANRYPTDTSLLFQIIQWCDSHGRPPPPPTSPSRALRAVRTMTSSHGFNLQENDPSPTSPPLTIIEAIMINLRDPRAATRQYALNALVEYTDPENRAHVYHRNLLNPVLDAYFSNHPSSTLAGSAFLLNISTDPSLRFLLATNGPAASRLLETLVDSHGGTPPEARDNAALAFYNLSMDEKTKLPLGWREGVMEALVDYWLDEGNAGRKGRHGAAMAVRELVRSSGENVMRMVEQMEDRLERILGFAMDGRRGGARVRKFAFDVLAAVGGGGAEEGRDWMVGRRVLDEMVRILRGTDGRDEDVGRWCLGVMWGMCSGEGMDGWVFKVLAREAGAEVVLREMREEWGEKGRSMAGEMLRVMWKKYSVKSKPKPLDVMMTLVEDDDDEEEEEEIKVVEEEEEAVVRVEMKVEEEVVKVEMKVVKEEE